jgi:3-oxoacyl-[acyl-carrier-protein] synthase III
MLYGVNMRDVYIAGTGSWLPETLVSNVMLYEKISNFDIERAKNTLSKKHIDIKHLADAEIFNKWVLQVTGIETRSFLKPQTFENPKTEIEEMGYRALKHALDNVGMDAADLDYVIVSTYTHGRDIPGPAAKMIDLLGRSGTLSGFSLNSACDGFNQALIDAVLRIKSGEMDTVAVVCSEKMSDKINYNDPTTAILFSDGAGACIVTAGKKGIWGFSSAVNYSDEHIEMMRGQNIEMKGGALVQRNAVNTMKIAAEKALEKADLPLSDIMYLIPHQANMRIINLLEAKMNLSENQIFVKCLTKTGNLSSATIPVALDLLRRRKLENVPYHDGTKAILTSVGGGYSYSAVVAAI